MHKTEVHAPNFPRYMRNSSAAAVAAVLVVGIAFIIVFSALVFPFSQSSFTPYSIANLDGRIIASSNNLKEAQVFFLEYPDGQVKLDRTGSEIEGSAIKYSFQRAYDDGRINEVRMFVIIDDANGKPAGIFFDCMVSHMHSLGVISYWSITDLQRTDCAK